MNLPSIRFFRPRFRPGRIFASLAALQVLRASGVSPIELVLRHVSGDWGNLSDSDRRQNELSIEAGLRLLSSYALPTGRSVWVITEWDRSATTILMPDES
ncbi:hypothetical protein WS58_15920 [Burkholderia pseudomultivorans]|uniref:hypothetical protein n=1 Tax=Burkholderia pseudomultivorans TaxID=1207504 RepID=UPI000756083E|nr:hypothetical protein [Burkholderia pseudomultivorans]KVC42477.1 hypothetical protein WS58_15920 [Burkholderia pseudomultivorans]HDR8925983.1 hypothetical protein [Burkholderia vietnamiensis]HDR9215992.1 hypothetical protein [Burkholderia vietnamiensis]